MVKHAEFSDNSVPDGMHVEPAPQRKAKRKAGERGDKTTCSLCRKRSKTIRSRSKSNKIYYICPRCVLRYQIEPSVIKKDKKEFKQLVDNFWPSTRREGNTMSALQGPDALTGPVDGT